MTNTVDFAPGDAIVHRLKDGRTGPRLIVQDPVRTSRGKLRVKSERATTVATTWWRPHTLPDGYELERRA